MGFRTIPLFTAQLFEQLLHILVADRPNPVRREHLDRLFVVRHAEDHKCAVRFFGQEGVGVLKVYLVVAENVQHVDQGAGFVLDLHGNYLGDRADIALLLEDLDRVEGVVYADADNSEVLAPRE